ncbi:MAG TPA: sugar ABC transporter permease [Caldilineaceae bacterium]|nr:sugar ABC transporter permease [Caldilineaceae bacterium]
MAQATEQRLPVGGAAARTLARPRRRFRRTILPWLFIAPILLLHLIVVIGPSIAAVYYSLTSWSGIGPAEFVGLDNYRTLLFEDMSYRKALGNNLIWLAFFVTVPFAIALVTAGLLAPVRRGGMFFRTMLFLPYILPSVISANIWRNLLSPRVGLGAYLSKLGLEGLDVAYLGQPETALLSIAFVDNWHFWGFLMVLFLAAMQNISPDLYDSAKIDGANRWQEFRHVTIPGIRPTLVFMLMMVAIWSFLAFEYIWILTQGGPAGSSEVLAVLVYKQAFNRFEAGYAAAIGLTMSFFAGLIIGLFVLLRRRGWEI